MIWPIELKRDGWDIEWVDEEEDVFKLVDVENFAYVTITGDLHRVQRAVEKVEIMVHNIWQDMIHGSYRSLFLDYNLDLYQTLMEKIRSLDELKAINQMNKLKLE